MGVARQAATTEAQRGSVTGFGFTHVRLITGKYILEIMYLTVDNSVSTKTTCYG